MNHKLWLLGLLLAALVLSTSGCSTRRSAALPSEEEQPSFTDDLDAKLPAEEPLPPSPPSQQTDPQASLSPHQGLFLVPDTDLQVQINPPFEAVHSVAAGNLTVTVPGDQSILGSLFYIKGTEALESMLKNMDAANDADPTITDFEKDVQTQEDGKSIYTFTYSAGESEGSPAGFYYTRYQETGDGFLTVQFTCPKINYAEQIMALFQSLSPATPDAKDAPNA